MSDRAAAIHNLKTQLLAKKENEGALRRAITENKADQRDIFLRLVALEYGVTIGSTVTDRGGDKWQVANIVDSDSRGPVAEGHRVKKNGVVGTRCQTIPMAWRPKK